MTDLKPTKEFIQIIKANFEGYKFYKPFRKILNSLSYFELTRKSKKNEISNIKFSFIKSDKNKNDTVSFAVTFYVDFGYNNTFKQFLFEDIALSDADKIVKTIRLKYEEYKNEIIAGGGEFLFSNIYKSENINILNNN